jgi:hypothetical protein
MLKSLILAASIITCSHAVFFESTLTMHDTGKVNPSVTSRYKILIEDKAGFFSSFDTICKEKNYFWFNMNQTGLRDRGAVTIIKEFGRDSIFMQADFRLPQTADTLKCETLLRRDVRHVRLFTDTTIFLWGNSNWAHIRFVVLRDRYYLTRPADSVSITMTKGPIAGTQTLISRKTVPYRALSIQGMYDLKGRTIKVKPCGLYFLKTNGNLRIQTYRNL